MDYDSIALLLVLCCTLVLFIWERWRYDVVACMALLSLVALGIIPANTAFEGFGHPAVITVIAVFLISRGTQNSGAVTLLTRLFANLGKHPLAHLTAFTGLVTIVSGFMNNIGALAILMPVALQTARRLGCSPSLFLMPMAFGSLLGGMTTLIGTPPNIIIANFRVRAFGEPFGMFDFSPVGVGVALVGVLFLVTIGWRLIPVRKSKGSREELFEIESYVTEMKVVKDSKAVGKSIRDVEAAVEGDVVVLGIVRRNRRLSAPSGLEQLKQGDILIVEADSETLEALTHSTGLKVAPDKELEKEIIGSKDVVMMEAIVMPGSTLINKHAGLLRLRGRFGVNLLGVARQGARLRARFNKIRLKVGDILLLRGTEESLQDALPTINCLPLAERGVRLNRRRILPALLLFSGAIALIALRIVPVQIAFCGAVLGMILTGLLSLREIYDAIEWPIVVLLGAMIPIGDAFEFTGTAFLIGSQIAALGSYLPSWGVLTVILVGTMFLSDLVNNAAAALLMAPIAMGVAVELGYSPDPFLMVTAIGASCAFLTPVGHQSNALVMGPGGYRFGDYWRVGLPLEILVAIVAIPLVMWFWPL